MWPLHLRLMLRRLMQMHKPQMKKQLYCSINSTSSESSSNAAGLPVFRLSADSVVRHRPGFLRNIRGRMYLAMLRSMSLDPDLFPAPLIETCRQMLPRIVSAIDADFKGDSGSNSLSDLLGPECLSGVRNHYSRMSGEQRATLARMAVSTSAANIQAVEGVFQLPFAPNTSSPAPPRTFYNKVSLRFNLIGSLTQLDPKENIRFILQMISQKPTMPALLSDGFLWSLVLQRNFIFQVMHVGLLDSLTLPDGSEIVDNGWTVSHLNAMYLRDAINEELQRRSRRTN